MTAEQEKQCHAIIHTHAVAAGAGNAIPVPGLGVATDVGTMVTMAMALSAVFGDNITENVAKNVAGEVETAISGFSVIAEQVHIKEKTYEHINSIIQENKILQ